MYLSDDLICLVVMATGRQRIGYVCVSIQCKIKISYCNSYDDDVQFGAIPHVFSYITLYNIIYVLQQTVPVGAYILRCVSLLINAAVLMAIKEITVKRVHTIALFDGHHL